MKFFIIITLISNSLSTHLVYHDDAQGTLEPFHLLYYQYSIHHNLLPKSVVPSISSSTLETPFEDDVTSGLLASLPEYLYSRTADIQHAYVHGLCSLLPSISEHFQNCIFGLSSRDIFAEYLLSIHDSDTWLPKLCGHSSDLPCANFFCNQPYGKSMNFIETKVPAINCRVLTIS